MDPSWAGTQTQAFMAGFGIVELSAVFLWAFLLGFATMRRMFAASGL